MGPRGEPGLPGSMGPPGPQGPNGLSLPGEPVSEHNVQEVVIYLWLMEFNVCDRHFHL